MLLLTEADTVYRLERDWTDPEQGHGEEYLYHAIQVKNIWIPMGDVFAN